MKQNQLIKKKKKSVRPPYLIKGTFISELKTQTLQNIHFQLSAILFLFELKFWKCKMHCFQLSITYLGIVRNEKCISACSISVCCQFVYVTYRWSIKKETFDIFKSINYRLINKITREKVLDFQGILEFIKIHRCLKVPTVLQPNYF